MKKLIMIILILFMTLNLAACSNDSSVQEIVQSDEENAKEEIQNEETVSKEDETEKNILVVYFSWSGNLEKMAGWVADETGGDLYRVMAAEAYPNDYNETADRAKREQDEDIRPEIIIDISEEQIEGYDTIFFGFPVWWYDLPMSMWTFLESYDLSGKIIYPFFSHEGSSNGAGALPTVERLAAGADVKSDLALSIRGRNVADSETDVRAWVNGLDY